MGTIATKHPVLEVYIQNQKELGCIWNVGKSAVSLSQ